MSGGKGGGSSSQTTKVEVPEYLENELQYGVQQARRDYRKGAPDYYPGQTYADFDPMQLEALNGTANLARTGSPLVQSAQTAVQDILNTPPGQNPYLDGMLKKLAANANAQVNDQFIAAGRTGSGANVATATQSITDAQLPYLLDQFNTDRNMQLQAAGIAPNLADYDFQNLSRIGTVGDAFQAQTQQGINEDIDRFNYDQTKDSAWLDKYLARINGSAANNLTTQTTTQEKSGGGLSSILGSALGIGSMFVPGGQFAGIGSSIGSALGMGAASGLGFSRANPLTPGGWSSFLASA